MDIVAGRHTCLATLGLTVGAIGCTAMLKSPDATFGASDAGAGALATLDCVDRPQLSSPDPANIDVTIIAFDRFQLYHFVPDDGVHGVHLDSYTPEPETSLQGCFRSDTDCASPATPEAVTDATGSARFVLSSTFDGFFRIRRIGSLPGKYFPGRLPSRGQPVTLFVSAMSPQELQIAAGIFDLPMSSDATGGSLAVPAYDCRGQPIAGATIELDVDAGFASYYFSPYSDQTGPDGARLFLDVPAGNVTISANLKDTGRQLATTSIYVSPGDYTVADIRLR